TVAARATAAVLVPAASGVGEPGVGVPGVAMSAARAWPGCLVAAVAAAVAGRLFVPRRLAGVLEGAARVPVPVVVGGHRALRLVGIAQVALADAVLAGAVAG